MSKEERIKTAVKEAYSSLAALSLKQGCCGPSSVANTERLLKYGYSPKELKRLPESVKVMAAGCGNPTGLGMIREGETVLDLGSGGGMDVFLASSKVGPRGRVIGLDMTREMVQRARANARKMKLTNVEFRRGEIERIPLKEESVDVIMSNCVICLSPDKEKVFREMFRVLRSEGRLAIADEVAIRPFTKEEKSDAARWCRCITGAITEDKYTSMLKQAGFTDINVRRLRPTEDSSDAVFSAFVSAVKPAR
jgi:SAM-dependent methyltransferase